MVVFDSTVLLPFFLPNVGAPRDPKTNKEVEFFKERIEFLIQKIEKDRTKIIVPTPVLSEILVRAGTAGPAQLERLKQSAAFKIESFDERAAIEVAARIADDLKTTGDKRGGVVATWAKIKFDRQIVAIAKVNGASIVYTDDPDVQTYSTKSGLAVIATHEIPIPATEAQYRLTLKPPSTR